MPPRSTVYSLPGATREELNRRIVAAGFGGYDDHAAWLADQGHAISVSAVKRYGKRLRRTAEADAARAAEATAAVVARVRRATEMARAINDATGDDPLAVPEKVADLLMGRLYELAADEEIDAKTLQGIARSLNDVIDTMAAIRSERSEPLGQARGETTDRVPGVRKQRGLSPETAAAIRAKIEDGNTLPLAVLAAIHRDAPGILDGDEED